jgi:hypothetical protein
MDSETCPKIPKKRINNEAEKDRKLVRFGLCAVADGAAASRDGQVAKA